MALLSWLSNSRSSYSLKTWIFHLVRLQERRYGDCTGKDVPDATALVDILLKYFEGWMRALQSLGSVTKARDGLKDVVDHIDKEPVKGQLMRVRAKLEVSSVSFKPFFEFQSQLE
jgi:hypothetical protein